MNFFEMIADAQIKNAYILGLIAILLTIVIGLGIQHIYLQTDTSADNPKDWDVVKLEDYVSEKFGGTDTIIILIELDKDLFYSNSPTDIRDKDVLNTVYDLSKELEKEDKISSVQSAGMLFETIGGIPENNDSIISIINAFPEAKAFFNKNNSATAIFVSAQLGNEADKINFSKRLTEIINSIKKPSGLKITSSGTPEIQILLGDLIRHDLVVTSGIAAGIIFLLVILFKRNLKDAILIFTPLIFGLVWMLGIMGWLGIPLSIATVGVSAMILGLGTEYGIFLVERYEEEKKKGFKVDKALRQSLPAIGIGITGSGLTTTAGFVALLFTTLPMIQNLGKILSLGILCILIATILVTPIFIVIDERITEFLKEKARGMQ
ncbi:MAG: MMPL family transporter [Candidatus ainarchaeum sp.]|nr:MMPL family transporter [Candidatus ainarchaeum sp.]